MRTRAFSLIELVVVVVILGVIGAIAVPRMSSFSANAKVHAAQANVNIVRSKVEETIAIAGKPPTAIDATWFAGRKIPKNPFATASDPRQVQQVSGGASVTEPSIKTVEGRIAYWYNRDNGEFRARVPTRGSSAATLALYNLVNGTQLTSLSDTAKPVGSGGSIEIELGG